MKISHSLIGVLLASLLTAGVRPDETAAQVPMPPRGICAHRGASETHPENTLAAFREAIRLGAQMIEFDVALSKDGYLVLMHDRTVDRTTDGTGPVSGLTLAELRKLDAGSWKAKAFENERIPTLGEALSMMPDNLWLNVHLKGGAELADEVARSLVAHDRLDQAFLACGAEAARAAKDVDSRIKICNMERQANSLEYVNDTIAQKADFIQLLGGKAVDPAHTKRLRDHGVRINYCCANEADKVRGLFAAGVEFPLVDRVAAMLKIADEDKIERLRPLYRSRLERDGLETPDSTLIEVQELSEGAATQGLALTNDHYFTATARSIFRYDTNWNLIEEKPIRIEGVNHLGAIDHHDAFLWAGLLHGPENGKNDPKLNRSIIAKIRARDLVVVKTWDITEDVSWIDPVCFDGVHLWVGDLSDLGIHRYRVDGDQLVRDGVFRYPGAMHFSQGIRVVGNKLYTIHTFGNWDGLFEFDLPDRLTGEVQQPTRVWQIAVNRMHLEGFDFVPGKANQIWHAQGNQVDRYELADLETISRYDEPTGQITHGPLLGHVTTDSALVWARCSRPGEYHLSARVHEDDSPVTVSARSTAERDGCVLWHIEPLQAGTRYRYEIDWEGKKLIGGDDYLFETASVESSAVVRLAFGSCAREDEGSSAVWRRMHDVDPHAVVLLGDTPYIDSTDLVVQRQRYGEFAAVPDFGKLLRSRSLYATWDDHDFGRNDTDGRLEGKENARRAFIEYHANPSYGDGRAGIYTKFRRGGVEVFLLDTRFFAATEPSPFENVRPSLLGKKQWQWLRRELKASTAPFKVLACGMIWNGAVRPGKRDHWATYPHERQALFDFIGSEGITGVVLVGGDVHRTRVLRHSTRETAGYQIPELITSPIHSGVIETADAPHPALVHDSGEPNSFLLITVDTTTEPATLNARYLNQGGKRFFELTVTEQDLRNDESQADSGTPAEQFAALLKEYRPVSDGMRKATTDLQRNAAVELLGTYPAKFVELAEKNPRAPIVLEILKQAVQALGSTDSAAQIAWETNRSEFPAGPTDGSADRIVALLLRDHVQSDKLSPVVDRARYAYRMEFERFLRTVLEKNPHRNVQAMACLSLAQFLNDRLRMLQLAEDRTELAECYEIVFGKNYLPELQQLGRAKLATRVESLFERAAEEYADVKIRAGTVGEQANSALYDIRHLGIGKQSPDIEGKDQNGTHFRLSDYRGKVVLLYFWSEY